MTNPWIRSRKQEKRYLEKYACPNCKSEYTVRTGGTEDQTYQCCSCNNQFKIKPPVANS
jgi:transposase-like protein